MSAPIPKTSSKASAAPQESSEPIWKKRFLHCQERAQTRFNMNLGQAAWFDMVNGRIPSVVVGEKRGRGNGKAQLVQFAGIPGTWVRQGKWVVTCWDGRIG